MKIFPVYSLNSALHNSHIFFIFFFTLSEKPFSVTCEGEAFGSRYIMKSFLTKKKQLRVNLKINMNKNWNIQVKFKEHT